MLDLPCPSRELVKARRMLRMGHAKYMVAVHCHFTYDEVERLKHEMLSEEDPRTLGQGELSL